MKLVSNRLQVLVLSRAVALYGIAIGIELERSLGLDPRDIPRTRL